MTTATLTALRASAVIAYGVALSHYVATLEDFGLDGLTGECARAWPAEYLATYLVSDGGAESMEHATARVVARLLARGWIERHERVIEVPADECNYSMFCGTPAHTLTSATYHATDKGRVEWSRSARD